MRVIAGRDQSFPFHSFHFQDFVLSKKKKKKMCFPPRNYNIFTWMFLFPLNARLSLAPLSLSARFIGFFFVDFFFVVREYTILTGL